MIGKVKKLKDVQKHQALAETKFMRASELLRKLSADLRKGGHDPLADEVEKVEEELGQLYLKFEDIIGSD